MLELAFLGSGNAFAAGGRYWSGFLLDGRYLFDAPPTLLAHLKRLGRDLQAIRVVFISHFHGDHVLGLPFLYLEYAELSPRREELLVVGPPGVEDLVEGVYRRVFPGAEEKGPPRRYLEVADGLEGSVDALHFQAVKVQHSPRLECFGFKVWLKDRVVAYSGDAAMCEGLFRLGEGADVYVLECSFRTGSSPMHLSLEELPEVRRRLPKPTIILTHLPETLEPQGLPGVLVAGDFASFLFP
ncbi:MAG TPA: MBL fold metallo-hydrolase [Dehalococcoidia bacterium]|nr:MBL fold metallo-hydrolase [Dehalococcoidia bacterium]